MHLPEAEQLIATLADKMRPQVTPETCLVGIHTGGVWLAERLHALLGLSEPLGSIDVSFYRDDYSAKGLHPQPRGSKIPFDVEAAHIVIVDDVLYTGRTPYALDDGLKNGETETLALLRAQAAGLQRQPRRAKAGGNVSQMHYARQGIITPEMEYVAIRENQKLEEIKNTYGLIQLGGISIRIL